MTTGRTEEEGEEGARDTHRPRRRTSSEGIGARARVLHRQYRKEQQRVAARQKVGLR